MDSIKEIKEIKEGLKSLLDRLEKLEKASCTPCEPFKKPFKVELPEDDHWIYCVDSDTGEIIEVEHGYYFETREEAERYLKERKLLFKIKKWAEIYNEGWEPDWSDDDKKKRYVYYNHVEERLKVTWGYNSTNFTKLPYFKSEEIAQECIELFGEEIKEVLC